MCTCHNYCMMITWHRKAVFYELPSEGFSYKLMKDKTLTTEEHLKWQTTKTE